MSEKKLGGHRACLGDNVQISLNWAFFAHFLRGAWGEFNNVWLNFNLSGS